MYMVVHHDYIKKVPTHFPTSQVTKACNYKKETCITCTPSFINMYTCIHYTYSYK